MNVPFLQIEPTNFCNLNCVMCTRRKLKHFGNMSLTDLKHIVEQVPGLRAVKLQGMGEPMLNPGIIPMMQYLRSRSIRVYTAMNGTVMPNRIDEFIDVISRIEYSIDSLDPAEHQKVRGGNGLSEVVENLRLLCKARGNRSGPMISINCVLIRPKLENLVELFKFAKETGVDRINFNEVQNWSVEGRNTNGMNTCDGYSSVKKAIYEMSEEYGIDAAIHGPVSGYSACKWARAGCFITWDGFLTPCCQRPDPDEINFGNVLIESFQSIYQSSPYTEFREMLLRGVSPQACINCSVYTSRQEVNGCTISCQS